MHQMDLVTDAALSLGKGIKNNVRSYGKEAGRLARSLGEFVDVEDVLKSIHKVTHPEQHAKRRSSMVHSPVDWSKHPPAPFRKFSHDMLRALEDDEIEGENNGIAITQSITNSVFTKGQTSNPQNQGKIFGKKKSPQSEKHLDLLQFNQGISDDSLAKRLRERQQHSMKNPQACSGYSPSRKNIPVRRYSSEIRRKRYKSDEVSSTYIKGKQNKYPSSPNFPRRASEPPSYKKKGYYGKFGNYTTSSSNSRQTMRMSR